MSSSNDRLQQDIPYGVVGTARLPRTVAGEQSAPLIIELTIDPDTHVVVDVACTLQLPCFQKLLLRLVGTNLHELEPAAHNAFAHYRGPLLRPALAALANATANAQDLTLAGSRPKNHAIDVARPLVGVLDRGLRGNVRASARIPPAGIGKMTHSPLDDSGSS